MDESIIAEVSKLIAATRPKASVEVTTNTVPLPPEVTLQVAKLLRGCSLASPEASQVMPKISGEGPSLLGR